MTLIDDGEFKDLYSGEPKGSQRAGRQRSKNLTREPPSKAWDTPGRSHDETEDAGLTGDVARDARIFTATVERGREDGNEHAVIADGQETTVSGDPHSVQIRLTTLDPTRPAMMFHNHPIDMPLSNLDLLLLDQPGIRRVAALTHGGDRFDAERGPKYSPETVATAALAAFHHLGLRSAKGASVEHGAIAQHALNLALAKLEVIRYRYHLNSKTMKHVDPLVGELVDRLVQLHCPQAADGY